MSLTLSITTPEGIVLAADSRQTYINIAGMHRVGSDSATKIFRVKKNIGVTLAGPAFLNDPDNPNGNKRSIGSFVQDIINEKLSNIESVHSVSTKLREYLEEIYKPQEQLPHIISELEKRVKLQGWKLIKIDPIKDGIGAIAHYTDTDGKAGQVGGIVQQIIISVAGYDEVKAGKPGLNVYLVYIPGPTIHRRIAGDPEQYGATWTGQTDVVQRVVLGYDTQIFDLDFIQAATEKLGEEKIKESLSSMQYNINWGAMTLFDAISFSELMIKTTTAIQRFSDGTIRNPAGISGVGGPVDIAVILPKEGYRWHQKKDLPLTE